MRKTIHVPVILMGYMNPILQYGFERFCAAAKAVGVDGLILPDLPFYEFEHIYGTTIKANELDFIFLVTPETSEERLRKLDALSSGFIYAVSSSATTGKDKDFSKVALYLKRLKAFNLKNPFLVGFGIKDKESFDAVNEYANGAIIGSAYIKALNAGEGINAITKTFLASILK
jgi:tryptophan synthase alpha chain